MIASVRRTRSQLGPQRQDTDVEFLLRHRPVTPDFRSQHLPHGVLAVLSEYSRVLAKSRPGFWRNGVSVLGSLFGLPP